MYVGQWPTFCGPVVLTYLEDILMEDCWIEDIDSVWHQVWPTNMYVGQWPIFCGTVILPYNFNTVNPHSLDIGSDIGHWLVFYD